MLVFNIGQASRDKAAQTCQRERLIWLFVPGATLRRHHSHAPSPLATWRSVPRPPAARPTHLALQGRDLEREVFGGSDSELSTDDEEGASSRPVSLYNPFITLSELQLPRPSVPRPKSPQNELAESSGSDSEDDYVQDNRNIGKAKKRIPGRRKRPADDGEERPVQRKRKRKSPVEIDLSELPPEQGLSFQLVCLAPALRFLCSIQDTT